MVHVRPEIFLKTIERGKIYYFKNYHLTKTDEPHYHIVVSTNDDKIVIFAVFTSQLNKQIEYNETMGLPGETLVFIKNDEQNGLKKESCINCNNYFILSRFELSGMYDRDEIEIKGYCKDSDLEQIITGIKRSPRIEEDIKKKIIPGYESDFDINL